MCGIIGIVGSAPVTERLIDSLKRLEYRGYDSAGVVAIEDGALSRRRAAGKISGLEALLREEPLTGTTGLATPAGPPTAHRPHPTPTRTSPGAWPSSTTASSRISPNSNGN